MVRQFVNTRALQVVAALLALSFLLLPAVTRLQTTLSAPQDTIGVFAIDGPIGPATSDYLQAGLRQTQEDGIYMAILTMDTPGGLDNAMRDIIQATLSSEIPVSTFVYPQGSRAGMYILYASHVAAIAPATNLGSATPVQICLPSLPNVNPAEEDEANEEPVIAASSTAMERKIINDAVAYIKGLAELHKRNVEWGESVVAGAANLPASEALAMKVIDIVA